MAPARGSAYLGPMPMIPASPSRRGARRWLAAGLLLLAPLTACGADPGAGGTERFAFVTNGVDPFWTVAAAGARAAAEEFGVEVVLEFPEGGAVKQKEKLEDLLVRGVDGIAVSPADGINMTSFLDEVAAETILITHDSDAPASKRRCFIGVDNYECGRACGELLRAALPDGGKVALFIGRMEQTNSQLRRQGVIDALLGREPDPTRRDPVGATPSGGGFTIVATRTDDFDKSLAKANAEDILVAHPDLAGMVGLWAYNAPACLEALRGMDRLGKVKLASFDEQQATLEGIADGSVVGTISQDPYQYGYHSVRILHGLAQGDTGVLPEGGTLTVEPAVVTAENVEAFRAKLAKDLGSDS